MSLLEGVRVLSFTTGIAGPRAGRNLRQLGAEVLKIESRNGGIDAFRYFRKRKADGDDEFSFDESVRYVEVNLGVRSVTIDLKQERGLELAKELVAVSDVVLDNYRPGVLDRIGLTSDALLAANPRIVSVKAPGVGSQGPRSNLGTWGPSLMAFSGLTYLWNHPGETEPSGSSSVFPDYFVSNLVPGIVVAALLRRDATGEPVFIDVPQADAVAYALGIHFVEAAWNGTNPEPEGNVRPGATPHDVYPCDGEDEWVAIVVRTDDEWRALCDEMGMPGLGRDPSYATLEQRERHRAALDRFVSAWTSDQDARDVMRRLQAVGVPAGAVMSNEWLAEDPHVAARGFVQRVDQPGIGGIDFPDVPLRAWDGAIEQMEPGPLLGEANEYVVRELLGRSTDEYAELTAQGVLD